MLLEDILKVLLPLYISSTLSIGEASIGEASSNRCTETAFSHICVNLGEKSYLIHETRKFNWYDADRWCKRQNAVLAQIESEKELTLISDFLNSKNLSDSWFWLGYDDWGNEGSFYATATGHLMTYAKWSPGNPDNFDNNEHCVHLWQTTTDGPFLMNDGQCSREIHFICEL